MTKRKKLGPKLGRVMVRLFGRRSRGIFIPYSAVNELSPAAFVVKQRDQSVDSTVAKRKGDFR